MRGGLAYAVIFVGAILGAITGTVAASVIAMGVISLPVMMRYGYDMRLATGVIAASGTITQLIPPSLVLVVLADQLGRSVGDMYAGAIGPEPRAGRAVLSLRRRRQHHQAAVGAGAAARGAHAARLGAAGESACGASSRRSCLIFLVLGTIFMGLATPTEAGAMGAVGAIALAAHPTGR